MFYLEDRSFSLQVVRISLERSPYLDLDLCMCVWAAFGGHLEALRDAGAQTWVGHVQGLL